MSRGNIMSAEFKHIDLKIVEPSFGSHLTDLIIDLDYLRKKTLRGSTPPSIFFQLKSIFHTMESIGSARIEGNRTTIAEYIETRLSKEGTKEEEIVEIQNMEKAMDFIDENIQSFSINRAFISELHKAVVKNLSPDKEWDYTPGAYRNKNVMITGSEHKPPEHIHVEGYMDELFRFISSDSPSKYDLLKTAITHHRFVWIHPFANGNGRTIRLLTYAMLVKQGFNVAQGRIINPTAVFCSDRNKYNQLLSQADSGTDEGMLNWCEYVLLGLKNEIEKIDRLLDYKYLLSEILVPAIDISREGQVITDAESKILKVAAEKQIFQAADIKKLFPGKLSAEISRILRRLREKNMILTSGEHSRKYIISFNNSFLLRGIIMMLGEKGFLPLKDWS
jgi:Fic family protein